VITTLAGGRVLAEKFGSTPPRVVALHGWGRDGSDFATILSGLDAVSSRPRTSSGRRAARRTATRPPNEWPTMTTGA